MQDEEFIQSFVEESKAHIETVENELLNIDLEQVDMESINNIFRAVHTIKGTSGFFNFKKIVSLSHALENLFGEIRANNIKMTNEMVDVFLNANDCLRVMIEDVMDSENVDISHFIEELSAFLVPKVASVMAPEVVVEEVENGFNLDQCKMIDEKKQLIRSEMKFGAYLYKMKRRLYGDLVNQQLSMVELLEEIESMGALIDVQMSLELVDLADGTSQKDVVTEIYFTTVLEKDFLPPILSEPESDIEELFVNLDDSGDAIYGPEIEVEQIAIPEKKEIVQEEAPVSKVVQDEKISEKQKNTAVTVEDSVRVNVTLLNSLLNLSSEMVLARNQLFRIMENHRKKIPGIEVIFQNINHITTNLQETIMQTRMQPVSNVFSKFPRIVRELAKKLDKDIVLELEGTDVELDKSIIEALGDPLTHLVRNAVDHGQEKPDDRLAHGKPRTGVIMLKAYHESGYVNIDVIDDGKGIDTEVIRRKAFEKGFISEADLETIGEQKSLQLLFRPGFSTADAITDISGRGVGMDVVKTNIEKLGGKIEIFTVLGKGTTFRLLLPLTLAIIPSLIVEAEKQKFALPQINVQEIVRIKANDPGRKIELINQAEVLRLRGKLLPIVRLSDVLGLERTYLDPVTGERKVDKREKIFHLNRASEMVEVGEELVGGPERRGYKLTNIVRIIVIKIGARRLGLSVDTIYGSEEILVKTLPSHIKGCNNYSGVTILGDGKVAMILDPSGIIENSNLRYIDEQFEAKNKLMISEAEKMREQQSLLLFKCSGPETLAIDMAMVSRVEEIDGDAINIIGEKEYIKFRGEPLRIIRPEDYLSIKKQETISTGTRKYFVIIPKLVKHPMGILIEKVQDTMQASINLNGNDSIRSKGLVGSTILNDKIVLLLNIYELFEMASPEQYLSESPVQRRDTVRILLVEDTPFFQKLEKDYLENAGYHVEVADNGKIAFQMLQERQYDIVVSDINMPEMDGLELVKRIRADEKIGKIPVIAVTSLTGELQKKEGLTAGFDAYEFKLDRSRLIEVLEKTLQRKEVTR